MYIYICLYICMSHYIDISYSHIYIYTYLYHLIISIYIYIRSLLIKFAPPLFHVGA